MAKKIYKTTFQFKRATAARWTELNPLLAAGEPGYETDTGKFKIGNGVNFWQSLPYANGDFPKDLTDEIVIANKLNELPKQGDSTKLYRIVTTKKLYQWNNGNYEELSEQIPVEQISMVGTKAIEVTAQDNEFQVGLRLDSTGNVKLTQTDKGLKATASIPAYSITKDSTSNSYAAIYHLAQDGQNTGIAISIPKDVMVKSGSVVVNPAGQSAGTYIVLEFQNSSNKVYINVSDLIAYVSSGSAATDMVVVNIDSKHKITASITNGSITKDKLNTSLQSSISKADTSIQEISGLNAVEAVKNNNKVQIGVKLQNSNTVQFSQDSYGIKADAIIPEYSIKKEANPGDWAATYYLTKNNTAIGQPINIPKDLVVESGKVETLSAGAWGEAGTYIILTLSNSANEKLYVNVNSLIEYVTSGSQPDDMVVINVDNNHKVTATIANSSITKEKLNTNIQTSLNKAESALQEHQDISGKADKVTGATEGNFAALDANGNLTDSGKKAAGFQPAGNYKTIQKVVAETGTANQTLKISQNANGEITATPVDIAITHEQVSGLHEIATTGSIYDITEGANTTVTGNKEYLVFYCGTATDLID